MKKLAILLVVVSPLLMVIGMGGCVAAISSIGNSSRQMTAFEVFGLLGAPLFFIAGIVLFIVDWRRRRIAAAGAHEGFHKPIAREPGGGVDAAVSISRIVVGSSVTAIGFGLLGLALNIPFLIWASKGVKSRMESDSTAVFIAVPLACLLACMPVGYAVLAWKEAFRRRIGRALQPYENSIMKAVEEIAADFVKSRTKGSSHAATLTACIQRVAALPEPVKAVLAWFVGRTKLSRALDIAVGSAFHEHGDWSALVPPAVTAMRDKLREALFGPRRRWLLYTFLANILLFGLLAIVTQHPLVGMLGDFPRFIASLLAGTIAVAAICLSKHPAARGIRDLVIVFLKLVMTVVTLIVSAVTGGFLVGRKRSQTVRWLGYALIEVVYGLLMLFAGAILCNEFEGEQSHIIVPVACAVFLVPSFLLMRWIRRTGTAPPPERTPGNS